MTSDPDKEEYEKHGHVKSMGVYKLEVALNGMRNYHRFLEKCEYNTLSIPPELEDEFNEYLEHFKVISEFNKFYVLVSIGVSYP